MTEKLEDAVGMELRVGTRCRSAVCETEVIVVRAPSAAVDLWCGGHAMVPAGSPVPEGLTIAGGADGGTLLGKRYGDADLGLEILCTKPGRGTLSLHGEPLPLKEAKPLPASD